MDPSPDEKQQNLRHQIPSPMLALKTLTEKNIPVVEYGSQISLRYGYDVILLRLEWAVPDELLPLSSQILADCGFPRVKPGDVNSLYHGPWLEAGFIHKSGVPQIHLYPLSFIGLTLGDTCKVPCMFASKLDILTPKPRPYVVSLIRPLLSHPVGDSFRRRVQDDLLTFIIFYVLDYKPLDSKDWDRIGDESEEEFQARVENAVTNIRAWDWEDNNANYLELAESIVRDCKSIMTLTSP